MNSFAENSSNRLQRWHMGFAEAPQSLVQQLSQAQWQRDLPPAFALGVLGDAITKRFAPEVTPPDAARPTEPK